MNNRSDIIQWDLPTQTEGKSQFKSGMTNTLIGLAVAYYFFQSSHVLIGISMLLATIAPILFIIYLQSQKKAACSVRINSSYLVFKRRFFSFNIYYKNIVEIGTNSDNIVILYISSSSKEEMLLEIPLSSFDNELKPYQFLEKIKAKIDESNNNRYAIPKKLSLMQKFFMGIVFLTILVFTLFVSASVITNETLDNPKQDQIGTWKNIVTLYTLKLQVMSNDNYAMLYLGDMYAYGYGVKQDTTKARELYTKAAERGNYFAMYHLGVYQLTLHHYEEAEKWFQKVLIKKPYHYCAMMQLGTLYALGKGIPANEDSAKTLFYQAAYSWIHLNKNKLLVADSRYSDPEKVSTAFAQSQYVHLTNSDDTAMLLNNSPGMLMTAKAVAQALSNQCL